MTMPLDLRSLFHEQLIATVLGAFTPSPAVAPDRTPLSASLPIRSPGIVMNDASHRSELLA